MLPVAFQLPAGVVLLVVGLLACFAGYRLFRAVLTIYGFILGALFASSLVAPSNAPAMLIALGRRRARGRARALRRLLRRRDAGRRGAWRPAVARRSGSSGARTEPGWPVVLLFAVVGAAAGVYAQRVVVILATAFGGAQTAVAGVVALLAQPGAAQAWRGRRVDRPPGARSGRPAWPFLAWLALGVAGALVQLRSGRRRPSRRPSRRR